MYGPLFPCPLTQTMHIQKGGEAGKMQGEKMKEKERQRGETKAR